MRASIGYVLAFALMLGTASSARGEGRNRTYLINLYGGFSFGLDQGENVGQVSRANGLAFGFGFDYKVLPQLYLGVEVLNLVKGHNARVNGVVSQYQLTYVSAPVQIKYAPVPQFVIHAGPYLASLLVSA